MDLKNLSWNVRGLRNRDKRVVLFQCIVKTCLDILCLQESKIREMSEGFVQDIWGLQTLDWLSLPSWGASRVLF